MDKKYNHQKIENNKYQFWKNNDFFRRKKQLNTFTMILPPPNVTGKLHLGHTLNGIIQDFLYRFKTLNDFNVIWYPGTDHAGIATQSKIEKELFEKSKKTRFDLGYQKFIDLILKRKEETYKEIKKQWENLGFALTFEKEKFTLDNDVKEFVTDLFIKLYKQKLIYQDKTIVNWDPLLKTAISNIEIEHKVIDGKLFFIKYQIENSNDFLEIATTRPETMFADVAIFINPKDKRYQKYHHKSIINPSNNQVIPIYLDEYVDITFGTGVMKCTPGHDFNDFNLSKKYNLPIKTCFNEDGTLNELGLEFKGLDRFEVRNKLINKLKQNNILVKIVDYKTSIGFSQRSQTIVEPLISKQWFLDFKKVINVAIKNQKHKKEAIDFIPKRFEKNYFQWLENIEPWCISRQLWWGHRLPVWTNEQNEVVVSKEKPKTDNWIQTTDVLDTWFSSSLWPLIVTNWHQEKKDNSFNLLPTSILVTGYDILFFWVTKMILMSLLLTNKKPFEKVLLHGLIRDKDNNKMSKSLNNGIDPLDVIKEYGNDSLRLFLLTSSSQGLDIRYSEEKIKSAWNFNNKLWNASIFILTLQNEKEIKEEESIFSSILINWISNQFNLFLDEFNYLINNYEFNIACNKIVTFVWDIFCSKYIELIKFDKNNKQLILFSNKLLNNLLILLNPFIPYLSEEIYQNFNKTKDSILNQIWPLKIEKINKENISLIDNYLKMATIINRYRLEKELSKKYQIEYQFNKNFYYFYSKREQDLIINLFLSQLNLKNVNSIDKEVDKIVFDNSIYVSISFSKKIKTNEHLLNDLNIKKEKILFEIKRANNLLENKIFIFKAPSEKVKLEKDKLINYQKQLKLIEKEIDEIRK